MSIRSIDDLEVGGKRVLLRVDINSPIDPSTGRIADENRIEQSLPTIRDLADRGARLVIICHQGDTLDYHNLVGVGQHAERLAAKLGRPVGFIDDVAGPAARDRITALGDGDILLLDNLRYLTEEVSTFERDVKLSVEQMAHTYLVRSLAPLFDFYVNDAFAAAHRASPSMIGFQPLLPSAAGRLLEAEVTAITSLIEDPRRPAVFLLGGLKVSDGFSMMGRVLADGLADRVLTSGVLGEIFLTASGVDLGEPTTAFIASRDLTRYVAVAAGLLADHPDRIALPLDVAVVADGVRRELPVAALPAGRLIVDIGAATISAFEAEIAAAGTVFVNGPAGAYEQEGADLGTRRLWAAVAATDATTLIGGGDTVASARKFVDTAKIDHVSTGGGALIRFVSGQPLPLLEAFGV
ncbi:MAG: phosphoglycerate kinase [Actinobacteria bacterium]|nr:phosphoglycerate kinase [Actinomycetota bacterium]MBU1493983.1 phosphoglycerate kinase [Actinomycetota bacterium]